MPTLEQQRADAELRAYCEPLLASAEASLGLLPVIAPQLEARLLEAARAGVCSIFVIRVLEGRLRLIARMDCARASLSPNRLRRG